MKVYLLRFTAELDVDSLPVVGGATTTKDVVAALRDAADEVEDYSDWQVERGNDAAVLDVKDTDNDSELVDEIKDAVREHFGLKYVSVGDVSATTRGYRTVKFPNWALCTLVNGDPLEDDGDRRVYESWEEDMLKAGYDLLSPDILDDCNEFCPCPEFGLACDTTKVRFFKRGKE